MPVILAEKSISGACQSRAVMSPLKTPVGSRVMVAVMSILFALMLISFSPPSSEASAQLTPHGTITIAGDNQFTSLNGVSSGSGTSSDPYIIQGWQIGPNPGLVSINVKDTKSYFTIMDVYLYSCSIGVSLNNVSHAAIESSRIFNTSIGISLYKCDSVKITSNTIEGNHIGISISYSHASQSGNTFLNNQVDVTRLVKKVPLIETWVGAAICVVVLIPLVIFVGLLVYMRVKHKQMEP